MAAEAKAQYEGPERRLSSRNPDEALTEAQKKGMLNRLIMDGEFTEGDDARAALKSWLNLEDVTSPAEDKSEQVPQTPLDEEGRQKVLDLFNSGDDGYEGFALPRLKRAKIDIGNLPEGSAPFWESPEAALAELTSNLTQEQLRVIEEDYMKPAIIVEPITAHATLYVRDTKEEQYDRRVVGETPFYISKWSATYLDRMESRDGIGKTGKAQNIVGWRIGIVDKARAPKILATDGEVAVKTLGNRVKDFHEKGHGRLGFNSLMDFPGAYGLAMDGSVQESKEPIDNVLGNGGTWTMNTQVDASGELKLVAGGCWDRYDGQADLYGGDAGYPRGRARVRLAVMFRKV